MAFTIGVPREHADKETRVALIPETVKRIAAKGISVTVESGAGAPAGFADDEYVQAGAKIEKDHKKVLGESDLVLMVQAPRIQGEDQVSMLREGAALITFLQPFANKDLIKRLAERKVTAMGMEMVPRITRAQNMDALSSMATVVGYKAVLLAANHFKRFFPMFMTAAGTIAPARTLVLGAGVAGLQAIATAKRLGSIVEAFDTRPVVKEQVESLGAKFIGLELTHEDAQDAGGYAKELSKDQHQQELELIEKRLPRTDIVITTAQIPGKQAPMLITKEMSAKLKPGSVVVDLAADSGGNTELSKAGEVVEHDGVTYIGLSNLPSMMPYHASQMYSKNLGNLVFHLVSEEGLKLDFEDPITAGVVVTHGGQVVHPALKNG